MAVSNMQYQGSMLTELQHENDLIALSQLAGVIVEPKIVRIIIRLLKWNIQPSVLHSVLHKICTNHPTAKRTRSSHSSGRVKGHKTTQQISSSAEADYLEKHKE